MRNHSEYIRNQEQDTEIIHDKNMPGGYYSHRLSLSKSLTSAKRMRRLQAITDAIAKRRRAEDILYPCLSVWNNKNYLDDIANNLPTLIYQLPTSENSVIHLDHNYQIAPKVFGKGLC